MNWFKETWWLVKQLFTTTKNKDKVQYKHMDHYPFSGYSAMSWCGYILTKKKTGKTTEELTHSKNPVTRKRAIFAQNAAKWNKGKKKKK